jgi:hypothetical protein
MKRYLSRLAARAGGIPAGAPVNESNHIKPIIHQWTARETAANSNPFKEINKPMNPVPNTNPFHIDKKPGDMILNEQTQLKHTPPHHDVTPFIPTETVTSYPIKQPEVSRGQESVVPNPPPSPQKSEALNVYKPSVEDKIADPFQGGTAETGKPGVADTVKPENKQKIVSPVSEATRFIHRQVSIQSVEDKRSMKEQVIRETTKPGKETVLQPAADSAAATKDKRVNGSINAPVSELRPVSPNNAVKFIPLKKENREPRLVIGRLKVEVVTPQPVTTQPTVIQKVTRVKESRPASAGYGVFSKMRFGLGQV